MTLSDTWRNRVSIVLALAIGIVAGWGMKSVQHFLKVDTCLDSGGAWFDSYPGCVYDQEAFDCLRAGRYWIPEKSTCQ